jgi:hypothetical protein
VLPTKKNLHDREINLAITLVLISILFVFCQLFKFVPDIYELVNPGADPTTFEFTAPTPAL